MVHTSPVDLLHPGPHRLIYAAIFGLMSDQFLSIVLLNGAGSICTSGNPYGKALCNTGIYKVLTLVCIIEAEYYRAIINADVMCNSVYILASM